MRKISGILITLIALLGGSFISPQIGKADQAPDCVALMDRLDFLMTEYDLSAFKNDSSAAEHHYTKIRAIINSTAPDQVCNKAMELKYVLDSLQMVDRVAGQVGEDEAGYRRSLSLFRYGKQISDLLLSFYKKGKLILLTEDYRAHARGRWLDREAGEYSSIGGYDCGASTIYLDPNQRPLDLAIASFHELDHLIKDKTGSPQDSDFIHGGKMDWKAYNLNEELSAMSFSAGSQADLQGIRYGKFLQKFAHEHFRIGDDLTLFQPGGPFMDIFQRAESCGFLANNCDFGRHTNDTEIAVDLFHGKTDLNNEYSKQNVEIEKDLGIIVGRLWSTYFTSSSNLPAPQIATKENGENLEQWLSRLTNDPSTIDKLIQKMREPSAFCRLYQADLLDGDVTGYLGEEFTTAGSSSSSRSAVRPCLRVSGGL